MPTQTAPLSRISISGRLPTPTLPHVKTCQSTLNRYLFASLTIILATSLFVSLELLQPWREALGQTLGFPEKYLWILGLVISGVALILLHKQVHNRLTLPFKCLAEQCRDGKLTPSFGSEQTKEARIVRDFILQVQGRADHRAIQLKSIESELKTLRAEGARSQRSIEELQDLVAAYSRIRSELTYDNTVLRREIKQLETELQSTKQTEAPQPRVPGFPYANRT